ncbi:TetR/AcrR family transcriptional regulator [Streptomyces sp. NPDC059740]|uniref:TetR/AcrR family transcriptional regulator n=1 Tax=Streptomyces sp. NPDC059740 TaxID=3346926 RepID=UPI00366570B2
MSPKQQRGEATVEQVLAAAFRVYADAGEQGLTVSALTTASGVSPGSIYHHFGNLDGVLTALTLRWLNRLLGGLVAALSGAGTARDGVRAVVTAYLDFVRDHPDAARLLHSATADRFGMAHARQVRDSQEARLSPMAAWITDRVAAGELAPLGTPLLESLVLGPVVAVARRALAVGDVDLAEATRTLPDRIWRAISP